MKDIEADIVTNKLWAVMSKNLINIDNYATHLAFVHKVISYN